MNVSVCRCECLRARVKCLLCPPCEVILAFCELIVASCVAGLRRQVLPVQPGPGEKLQERGHCFPAVVRHHHAQHRLAQLLHQTRAQDEAGGFHQKPQGSVTVRPRDLCLHDYKTVNCLSSSLSCNHACLVQSLL